MNDFIYKSISIEELKTELDSNNINYQPYTLEQVLTKKEELGGMPKLLEDYFLTIGWFSEISHQGCGCHIDPLTSLHVITNEELKEEFEERVENEVDDYLIFGREAVSVDEFAIKRTDFNQEDPIIYSFYDLEGLNADNGLMCSEIRELPKLSNFFSLIVESLK